MFGREYIKQIGYLGIELKVNYHMFGQFCAILHKTEPTSIPHKLRGRYRVNRRLVNRCQQAGVAAGGGGIDA